MKNKSIIAAFLSIFLLIAAHVKAANFTDYQNVDINKTWTIKFTSEVGFDDITKESITVIDSKGNKVPAVVQLTEQDKKTVTVAAPQGGYTPGENYVLTIGKKAHSCNGKNLIQDRILHFNVRAADEKSSKINDIIINVGYGDSYLPNTITAIMGDGSSKNIGISWDKQSSEGLFNYRGIIDNYNNTVKLYLTGSVVPIFSWSAAANGDGMLFEGKPVNSNSMVVILKLAINNPEDYTIMVKGSKAKYKENSKQFEVLLNGVAKPSDLVYSDFVIVRNSDAAGK